MSIERLTRLIAPPKQPVHPANAESWSLAERNLGVALPADLYEFSKVYGSGTFRGDTDTALVLYNPASPEYSGEISFECQRLRDAVQHSDGKDMPFSVFPETGGLLPFGLDECNVRLCWRTIGPANSWSTVVVWQRGPDGCAEVTSPLA